MNNKEAKIASLHAEQEITGKQQLLIKMQLASSNESTIIGKQQLAIKAGLARKAAVRSAE